MQKRRVPKGGSDLPMTMSDVAAIGTGSISNGSRIARVERRIRRQTGNSSNSDGSCLLSFGLFFLFLFMLGFILFSDFDYVSHHPVQNSSSSLSSAVIAEQQEHAQHIGTSLSQFSSLKYALDNADIVGLYFAASWCPMSTPITQKIDKLFSAETSPLKHRVLSPESSPDVQGKKDFALVYVASDDSEEDMLKYSKSNWFNVPFQSEDRENIKRHFRICAQVEMGPLGIERRRAEIPSLVIIDSLTHGVLSISGKDDIVDYGQDALDHWMNLMHLVRSMEDKYAAGNED